MKNGLILNLMMDLDSWVDMQSSKINIQAQSCCCFSQYNIKFDLKQEVKIPALFQVKMTRIRVDKSLTFPTHS